MLRFLLTASFITLISSPSLADDPLKARAEGNIRAGNERSIYMTEFWIPFAQNANSVLYGDLRMMSDNQDNFEGNLGLGYRTITTAPVLGEGVAGANIWIDRRTTERNSKFNQITLGTEWLSNNFDVRLNGYIPLSDKREIEIVNQNPQAPALVGTGIVVDTNGREQEEPLYGFDLELGLELGQHIDFIKKNTDSLRIYGGGFYFNGDDSDDVAGWSTRVAADVTQNIEIGARFQRDDERGSQGFLELTLRFPFGHKQSYRKNGLRARLDESPERDIDIVTGSKITDAGSRVAVVHKDTGEALEVLSVDNSAVGVGDGTAENPFSTLSDAQNAASDRTIIYVKRGDGTSDNQNQGITLDKTGQQLIGSGANFVFDRSKFTTANGASPTSTLIVAASAAPVLGNINAGQDGVTVAADNVVVAGITVDNDNTGRDGVVVRADGAAVSAQNVTIDNVRVQNSRIGVYLHGTNSGRVSAKVQNTITTSNSQHGVAVYDDTDATFDVDLGGGSLESTGNNVLAGNMLEDLAVDYDGRDLSAQNNWWGQASGADTDTPDIGIAPQIYYGAPINDGLVGHWTFDTEWTTNSTAYDRSGNNYNGTLQAGLSLANQIDGKNREGLTFDAGNGHVNLVASNTLINGDSDFTLLSSFSTNQVSNTPDNNFGGRLITVYRSNAGGQSTKVANLLYGNNDDDIGLLHAPSFTVLRENDVGFDDGEFHTLISTYDATTDNAQVYYDGASSGSSNLGFISVAGSEAARIGVFRPDGAAAFAGEIDDTRIYNRTLTVNEVSEINRMNTSSSVNTSNFLSSAP